MSDPSSDPTRPPGEPGPVLFVCEHGAAKSVVAAAHFNRLAAERGLALRAISRGTDPDEEIHPAAAIGLGAEGLEPQSEPVALAERDLAAAPRVIAFSPLPERYGAAVPVEVWSVPAVSEGYAEAREAIVANVERLIEELVGLGCVGDTRRRQG